MQTYELKFRKTALKEWRQLDSTVRKQFLKKLAERLVTPHVSSMADCYKIKLVASGFRLVYQVVDGELIVLVIAIGKREADDLVGFLPPRSYLFAIIVLLLAQPVGVSAG